MNSRSLGEVKRFKEVKLILEQNEIFHIVFDLPTPRPHFIILFNPEYQIQNKHKKTLKDLNENELRSLVNITSEFGSNNNLMDFTLSFHTGYWASTKYFHAHICVKLDLFIKFIQKTDLDSIRFNPTKKWQIKAMSNQSFKDLYMANVANSEKVARTEANSYRTSEINLVKRNSSGQIIDLKNFINNQFDIFYDLKQPVLKFILDRFSNETKEDKYLALLQIMTKFASDYGLFSNDNGCHVCLRLKVDTFEGQIKMSGDQFYKMHPLPEAFLENFEINSNYTIET